VEYGISLPSDKEVIMAQAISMEKRQRVFADRQAGMKTSEVARKYGVSPAWVRRLLQFSRERGDINPRCGGGARASVTKINSEKLTELVKRHPDATLVELGQLLGVDCCKSAIWMALEKLKVSYKKSRFMPPSRIGPMSPSGAPHGV
jgi:transposase